MPYAIQPLYRKELLDLHSLLGKNLMVTAHSLTDFDCLRASSISPKTIQQHLSRYYLILLSYLFSIFLILKEDSRSKV